MISGPCTNNTYSYFNFLEPIKGDSEEEKVKYTQKTLFHP